MTTANYVANVPKLLGRQNYSEWMFAAENFLILEGTQEFVKREPGATGTEVADDQRAKAKLILTIDPSLYVHVKDVKTTSQLWNKLRSLFDDSGFTRRISLLRNLISIRLENCSSMTSYVTQIIETGQKLSGTGFNINDEWIGSLLLAGLPEKYSPMIMAIEHSGINISTDSIKTKLLDMEVPKNENEKNGNANEESAFASSYQHTKNKRSIVHGSTSKKYGADNRVGNNKTPNSKMAIKCFKCKEIGHYRSQCSYNPGNSNSRKQTNAFSAVFLNGVFSKNDWYVDSGASAHLTANESWLQNVSYEPKINEIIVANKESVPVLCTGDVKIATFTKDGEYDILVKDVLCVPDITTNLLSVSELIRKGNKVTFKDAFCYINNRRGELVATAFLVNGVYKLNMPTISTMAVSAEIWHRRLGHINNSYLNEMETVVEGMSFTKQFDINKSSCQVCCEGKQCRLPFPKKGNRSDELLKIVHTDIAGPMETSSIGGSRYYLIFVDDFSRMTFVYFLKNKNEAFKCFKEFKAKVENQLNSKIKILRSDNGGEYCSNNFEDFLKENGICHQKTNIYTPEQNGLCERMNRTIVEKARCLLFDAKLEKKFWAEAVNTAVYLKNRSISSGLSKTPYELWHGKKPDLSNIRLFGSPIMVHIPKERRVKWDKKAKHCILVGYAENVKGYRVYDPYNNVVTVSRDVIVMEEQTGVRNADKGPTVWLQTEYKDSADICTDSVGESVPDTNTPGEGGDPTLVVPEASSEIEKVEDKVSVNSSPVAAKENQPRAKRERKLVQRFGYTNACVGSVNFDELSLKEALNGPEKQQWLAAVKDELASFEENQAWELVSVPDKCSVVQCRWVLKKKYDSDNIVRYRARLVAKGYTQQRGIDYDETFSPVVRHTTLRLLFALSVQLDLDITHLDVTTAFLNGFLEETIYMEKPEGFNRPNSEGKVLKLKRAIYGLKQSSRAWYRRVDECLINDGYNKSRLEPCLYIKQRNSLRTIVALYVDDFFLFSNDLKETVHLKNILSSQFKLKDLGQIKQCLGMNVNYDKNKGVICLSQESYIDQLLDRFNIAECKVSTTPMEEKLNLDIKCNDKCENIPYQQLIGSLMYLSVLTRPDITFSVSYLSQFNNSYNNEHWLYAKRVLRYLKKTKSFGLKYSRDGNKELKGFVDADWASNHIDRKSYTGLCFVLSGCAVSWETKKQKTVALSSTEAEYMGITEACREAVYLRSLMYDIIKESYTVTLYNDNQSALKLSLNNSSCHKRTKHIDVRYHFTRDCISNKIVHLNYLQTNDMPADLMTKALNCNKHYKFMNDLGIQKVF